MGSRVVVWLVPVACVVYGAAALATRGAWLAAAAGAMTAWVLGRRHDRARFAAYVFFSAVAVRSALTGRWPGLALAVGAVLVMQTPAAVAAWPRLRPGRRPGRDDRMRRP